MKLTLNGGIAAALLCGLVAQSSLMAKQGATDPIPGTSKGATNSGGGGGGGGKKRSTTPAPAPAPAPTPAPSLAAGPLTFTAAGSVNGIVPVCTGDYRVDPYYPTLLDMTVNVDVSSLDVLDGTVLYVNVIGGSGTLYPYTSNAIVIVAGAGACSEHVFVTTDATLAGVVVTDDLGNVVFTGN